MEGIRQFKKGKFKEYETEGYDSKKQYFSTEFNPDDLIEDRDIKCELDMRSVYEDLQNTEKAIALKREGLASTQTLQDNLLKSLVSDSDAEENKILVEAAKKFPPIQIRMMLAALAEDKKGLKDPATLRLMASLMSYLAKIEEQEGGRGGQPEPQADAGAGGAAQPGQLGGMPATPQPPQVPPDLAMQVRLGNMGLNYAKR